MSHTARPLIDSHHVATFQSRGVSMPFTTPLLAGARMRESARTGIELTVPNPSGGRGVYILHWLGVRALCNPTVHDTMLFRRCSRLMAIDPASIRNAALDVALEGHAGRTAALAAEAAVAHDHAERLQAQYLLLTGLMDQVDPYGAAATSPDDRSTEMHRRANAVLNQIAPALGRPAAHLAAGLAVAGNAFAPIGIAFHDRDARIPRLLGRLNHTHTDLAEWLAADPSHDVGGLGRAVMLAMARVCAAAESVLEKTRMALTDPMALLKHWVRVGIGVVARAKRCDWLLDGWERVGLLWLSAGNRAAKRAALLEMASLMPVLPREAMEWTSQPSSAPASEPAFRVTSREDTWRTRGAAFALIERNEKLLAMST